MWREGDQRARSCRCRTAGHLQADGSSAETQAGVRGHQVAPDIKRTAGHQHTPDEENINTRIVYMRNTLQPKRGKGTMRCSARPRLHLLYTRTP